MRQSLSQILRQLAESTPDRTAVIDQFGSLTLCELYSKALSLAHLLQDSGVELNDRVLISFPNDRSMVVACTATWIAGATPVPVPLTDDVTTWRRMEKLTAPAAVVGWAPTLPHSVWFPSTEVEENLDPMADLAADCWKGITSSGSTGRPKVIFTTAPALMDASVPVTPFIPMNVTQLVVCPLTHAAAFTYAFRGLMTGHTLVILNKPDERQCLEAMDQHQVGWCMLPPSMMHRIMRLPSSERDHADLSHLQSILHIGAPCPPALKLDFIKWLGAERVIEVYAGSESNGLTMISGSEWLEHQGSVGKPIGGTEVQIRSSTGRVLEYGDIGTVWLRSGDEPSYMYSGANSRRDDDGWDTLGDVGWLADDGYLYLADRSIDLFRRGTSTVFPAEVESRILRHPAVKSAIAFGFAKGTQARRRTTPVKGGGGGVFGRGFPKYDLGIAVEVNLDDVSAAELLMWINSDQAPSTGENSGVYQVDALWTVNTPVRNDAGKTSRQRWAAKANGWMSGEEKSWFTDVAMRLNKSLTNLCLG